MPTNETGGDQDLKIQAWLGLRLVMSPQQYSAGLIIELCVIVVDLWLGSAAHCAFNCPEDSVLPLEGAAISEKHLQRHRDF